MDGVSGTQRTPLLTLDEVRAWLRLSRSSLHRIVAAGELQPLYPDGKPKFVAADVERFLAARRGRKDARNAEPRDQRGPATNRHPEDSSTLGAQEDPN